MKRLRALAVLAGVWAVAGAVCHADIFQAAVNGDVAQVTKLLADGANPNSRGIAGCVPLHFATRGGHPEVVKVLLAHKADVNAKDAKGRMPLHWAAQFGEAEVAKALLERGADVNAKDEDGDSPLHDAASMGEAEVAKALLERGADVNAKDDFGWTPLHEAVDAGGTGMAGFLLEHEADVDPRNDDGDTPLHWAAWKGHVEVTRLLLEHKANVAAKNAEGNTPLHLAAERGQREAAEVLIEHNADITSVKNNAGATPRDLAGGKGHTEVARLLAPATSGGPQETAAYEFETGTEGWRAIRMLMQERAVQPLGGLSVTNDAEDVKSGKGALQFSYTAARGSMEGVAVANLDAAEAQSLRFWIKASREALVGLTAREKDGSQYGLPTFLSENRWRRVRVNLADLALGEGSMDENGVLDPDELVTIGLFDQTASLVALGEQAGSRRMEVELGPSTLWLDQFELSPEPAAPLHPRERTAQVEAMTVDSFDSGVVMWLALGPADFWLAPRNGGSCLEIRYLRTPPVGMATWLLGGLVEPWAQVVSLKVKSDHHPTWLRLVLEEKDGSEYVLKRHKWIRPERGWCTVEFRFAYFALAENSADENQRLDPEQISTLRILDMAPDYDAVARPGRIPRPVRLWIDEVRFLSQLWHADILDATEAGDAARVRELVAGGADVNAKDTGGETGVHRAAGRGDTEVARLLIEHGAEVNAKDPDGQTPLHRAAVGGKAEVAKLLIERGAEVNAKDAKGRMPLHRAAVGGKREVAKLLIEHGAEVNAKDDDGETPLHEAASWGRPEVAKLLIEDGADVNAKDEDDWTPLHKAALLVISKGDLEVARVLIEHGADVNAKDEDDFTPLHRVALSPESKGDLEVARVLLEHGADVNARTRFGDTPLSLAAEETGPEARAMVKLLRSHGGKRK
ncbi:MAG: ankyrin repeat domain-containing protein [Armatimonadota bacterium]